MFLSLFSIEYYSVVEGKNWVLDSTP